MKQTGRSLFRSSTLLRVAAFGAGLPLLLAATTALPAAAQPGQQLQPTLARTAPAAVDPQLFAPGRYIVVMAEQPIAMYDGGTPGLAPTKPQAGQKLDTTRPLSGFCHVLSIFQK